MAMEVTLRLLGWVNRNPSAQTTVPTRYIAAVTAEQLAGWLSYERTGKRQTDRYRLRDESFIQIDKEIQRGRDAGGALLQIPKKVEDIAATLLGASTNSLPYAFLGTLIWNVRPGDSDVQPVKVESLDSNSIPEFSLRIRTEHVWLTDSAHRHLGIAEAYKRAKLHPTRYPRFPHGAEFVVEVYQLDRAGEKALFYELNALQRRISAAKRVELDVASSAGFLKDTVRSVDEQSGRLFVDNIEVTANQNRSHTLMTMSVFVASIQLMFPKSELDEAKNSSSKREELAEFYCDFFYKLRDTIVVSIFDESTGEKLLSTTPFYNLYLTHIQPALEVDDPGGEASALEARLDAARDKANAINRLVRLHDIANHNSTIRALAKLASKIRFMPKWDRVIDYLQTALNAPLDGRFFQKKNHELFEAPTDPRDTQIASLNEDKTINVQVQSQTIAAIYKYLRVKLQLNMMPRLWLVSEDLGTVNVGPGETPHIRISRRDGGSFSLEAECYVAAGVEEEEVVMRLTVEPEKADWKDVKYTGSRRLEAVKLDRDEGYEHPNYGNSIHRWVACFNVKVGQAPKRMASEVILSVRLTCPDMDPFSSEEVRGQIRLLLE